jgi:hypothetical protein
MTRNQSRDFVQEVLKKAGVRSDEVDSLSQELLEVLQPVDADVEPRHPELDVAIRFELERSWGG